MANNIESQIVYEHLVRLCGFRGANVTSRVGSQSDPAAFAKAMETNHYVSITAERSATDIRGAAHILIVQFSPYRYIDASSQKFNAFLERQIRARPADEIEYNVILVSSGAISSTISRTIAAQRAAGIIVEHFNASMFLIVVPEHANVPRHTIVPRDEVDKICRELHMMVSNFPCIIAAGTNPDPMAVWLGLRPGMIARIDRPSETAGIETVYRRCV